MNVILSAKVNKIFQLSTCIAKNFSEKKLSHYFFDLKAPFPASRNEMKLLILRS